MCGIDIRPSMDKEIVFSEQGKAPLTFEEVQEIVSGETWDQTLEELLSVLD